MLQRWFIWGLVLFSIGLLACPASSPGPKDVAPPSMGQPSTWLDAYDRSFRGLADPWPGRIEGLAPGPDGPNGPWQGSAGAFARYHRLLWREWSRLELARVDPRNQDGGAGHELSQQLVILKLLGGAARHPLRDGGMAGVDYFVEAQAEDFEAAERVWRRLLAAGEIDASEVPRLNADFAEGQLRLYADYTQVLASTAPSDARARRAAQLRSLLLYTPDGGVLPLR